MILLSTSILSPNHVEEFPKLLILRRALKGETFLETSIIVPKIYLATNIGHIHASNLPKFTIKNQESTQRS